MLELFYHLHFRNKIIAGTQKSPLEHEQLFLSYNVSSLFTYNMCARCALRRRTNIANENLQYENLEHLKHAVSEILTKLFFIYRSSD